MLGINLFFDYDLSCYYFCVGFGVEYWCDYLKLSSNVYIGLIGWCSVLELDNDYEVCLVNGWDLCVEGWLLVWL